MRKEAAVVAGEREFDVRVVALRVQSEILFF